MTKELVLFVLYAIVHLVAIFSITREDFLYLPTKVIPILVLLFVLGRNFPQLEKRGKFVFIGLLFSLAGDSFLALPNQTYFIPGLGSFLVAQLLYSFAFTLDSRVKPFLAIPFLVFGSTFFYALAPKLGPLVFPVGFYISAICLMGWRASARSSNISVYTIGLMGALAFILSDSIIAYSMFLNPGLDRVWASFGIMSTYYLAQWLIFRATQIEEQVTSL